MKIKTLFQMSKQDLIDYAMTCFFYEMLDSETTEAEAISQFSKMSKLQIIRAIQA